MDYTSIHAAKTHFSELLARVANGEDVVIARAGKPIAKLVPISARKGRRTLGLLKGRIKIEKNFDARLPKTITDAFNGRRV